MIGGMVVQWLALSPHSKVDNGLTRVCPATHLNSAGIDYCFLSHTNE